MTSLLLKKSVSLQAKIMTIFSTVQISVLYKPQHLSKNQLMDNSFA